jgi:hypothetical protein
VLGAGVGDAVAAGGGGAGADEHPVARAATTTAAARLTGPGTSAIVAPRAAPVSDRAARALSRAGRR